jgi:hypothetical protein
VLLLLVVVVMLVFGGGGGWDFRTHSKKSLDRHVRVVQLNQRNFPCGYCNFGASMYELLLWWWWLWNGGFGGDDCGVKGPCQ